MEAIELNDGQTRMVIMVNAEEREMIEKDHNAAKKYFERGKLLKEKPQLEPHIILTEDDDGAEIIIEKEADPLEGPSYSSVVPTTNDGNAAQIIIEKEDDPVEGPSHSSAVPTTNGVLDESSFASEDTMEESKAEFKWNKNGIKRLLEELKKNGFGTAGIVEKRQIFKNVAASMRKYGYQVSSYIVSKKYSNLLHTYKRIKDKLRKSGNVNVSWEFYSLMDEILGKVPASKPPPHPSLISCWVQPDALIKTTNQSTNENAGYVLPYEVFASRLQGVEPSGERRNISPQNVPTLQIVTSQKNLESEDNDPPKVKKGLKRKRIDRPVTDLLEKFYVAKKEEDEKSRAEIRQYRSQMIEVLNSINETLKRQEKHLSSISCSCSKMLSKEESK